MILWYSNVSEYLDFFFYESKFLEIFYIKWARQCYLSEVAVYPL